MEYNKPTYAQLKQQVADLEAQLEEKKSAHDKEICALTEEYQTTNEELQRAKDLAEANARKYKSLFENSLDGIVMINANGRFINCNKIYSEMLGYSLDELQKIDFYEITPKKWHEWERVEIVEKQLLKKDYCDTYEKEYIRKDGTVFPVELTSYTVRKENNEIDFLWGVAKDITNRKKAERELIEAKELAEENEEKFRTIFNMSLSMICIADINTATFKFINPAFNKILGFDEEKLLDKPFLEFIHPDDIEPTIKVIEKELQAGNPVIHFENRYLCKDNSYKWLEWNSFPIPEKGITYAIAHDVTNRKKTETELIEAKEIAEINELKYKTIFESAPVGIFRSTKQGRFIELNQALALMLGYNSPQHVLENVYDIGKQIYVKSEKREEIVDKISSLNILKYENVYRRKNGELFYANLYLREIKDENSRPILEGIVEETTKRKKYENDLKAAKIQAEESDRLKTAFLQNISHEIRTPLNAICGFSQMLNKPKLTDSKRQSYVSIIQNSSNQLLAIVSDILAISALETRQEKIYEEQISVNEIIIELLATYKQQLSNQNISLYAKQLLSDKEATIYTDKTKIIQILTNLLTNALKFTHEGSIEFGYKILEANHDLSLQFYVKDTGIGIKQELQDKIFERFRQADDSITKKYGGTGLGLSISKGYVELLGGKIWLESQEGKGTTFYFTIPYKPTNKSKINSGNKKSGKKQKNILVAEDEEFNYLFIEEILLEKNINIIHAKNGQEAVDILNAKPDIDLVLMDIKMPVLDGYSAAKIMKKIWPDVPIIAQTAYALEHEIKEYIGAFDDYLAKPIQEEHFFRIISGFIEL